jgi:hypothetical protein
MRKQVKLTESELYNVIEESVKSLVMEYGEKNPKVRSAMAKAAKRALDNGDDETYHRAVKSIADAGGSNEALQDFNDKFEKESLNSQPANNITGESRRPIKVSESQLMAIVGESVKRVLREVYTGDEPFVPNKYPGQMPKFNSKEEYRQWCRNEAPDDWFDWADDRKCQRTGIQPGQSGLATRAMRDRRDGKMSWNNDKNYNKFQMLKQKNGIQ